MKRTKRKSWTQADMDSIVGLIWDSKPGSKEYGYAIKMSADHFKVTPLAVQKKYVKYINGQGFRKGRAKATPNIKKKTRFWSKADLKTMASIISNRESEAHGIRDAAKHFGVTVNAITCRYRRFLDKKHMARTNIKNSIKVPMKRKKRGAYKKRFNPELIEAIPVAKIKAKVLNEMTLDIKDYKIDLVTKKITLIF